MPPKGKEGAMDAGDRELFRHLMAKATAMLENAAGLAAEGQSPLLSQDQMIEVARRLQAAAQNVAALADAATTVASSPLNHDD